MSKRLIPNIITLSNMILGILSLRYTMNGLYKEAAVSVLFAMVLDGMDGRLARHLNVTSDFGKELDSLSDLVSFGVAPALLTYSSVLLNYKFFGLMISIIFVLCGAVRLARFNVLNIKEYFVGIPITFAGPLMAIFVLLSNNLPVVFFPVLMLILAALMVSNIKVPKY